MNNVNKTLYIPLYGKFYVSRKGIILSDKKAEEIWVAEGFELKGKSASKWLAYYMGMRSKVFDNWLNEKVKKATEVLQNESGKEPTIEEIADYISMEPEEVVLCMEAVVEVDSMEQCIYGKDGKEISLKDRLASDRNEQEELMNHLFLQQLLETLQERDRRLILLRYFENKTQTQVAEILGISQVQVSRLEKKILRQLKELA